MNFIFERRGFYGSHAATLFDSQALAQTEAHKPAKGRRDVPTDQFQHPPPDDELKTANTSVLVLNAYTTAMALQRDERKAVEAAIRAWRERNPHAGPQEASPAVAHILITNMQTPSRQGRSAR